MPKGRAVENYEWLCNDCSGGCSNHCAIAVGAPKKPPKSIYSFQGDDKSFLNM